MLGHGLWMFLGPLCKFSCTLVSMVYDSGSQISILSAEVYRKNFSKSPLQPSSVTLTQYNGDKLRVLGSLATEVIFDGQAVHVELFVVPGLSIFGKNLQNAFGLRTLNSSGEPIYCNSCVLKVSAIDFFAGIADPELKRLLHKYEHVFWASRDNKRLRS